MPADKQNRFFNSHPQSIILRWLLMALLILAFNADGSADEGIASSTMVERAGLTVDWFAQSGIGARGEIVDWDLNINENNATTYYVVEAGNFREVISERSLNSFGEPFGKDGAVEYIEIRKEIIAAELKNNGDADVEIKVDQYTLPETTIYLMTSEGLVSAIDADTGKTAWTTQLGTGEFPSIGIGASDQYIAGVVGSTVYCIDPAKGKVIWSRRCKYAVSAAPAVSEDYLYVPLLDGRMEALPIEAKGLGSFVFVAQGAGTSRPMVTEKTVAWSTREGDLNVAARYGDRNRSISYRLRTDEAILNSPTYKSGKIFVGSLDGYIYALDEDQGSILWELSIGEEISQSPFPVGDSVYVISDEGRMYGIDVESGEFKWRSPIKNFGKFLGASKDGLYLTDAFGSLLVVNPESGAILSRVEAGNIRYILPNYETDRIYIASDSGLVQCLHEVASKRPYFHDGEYNIAAQPAEIGEGEPAAEMTTEENPFASTGSEPVDSTPVVSGSEEDPFATKDKDEPMTENAVESESEPTVVEDEEADPFAVDDDSSEPAAEDQSGDDGGETPDEDDPFK
jgi:outer membrane protein assembly factor BamB